MVISDPILKPIDTNKNIVIMCDARQTMGFGYALLQLGDDLIQYT